MASDYALVPRAIYDELIAFQTDLRAKATTASVVEYVTILTRLVEILKQLDQTQVRPVVGIEVKVWTEIQMKAMLVEQALEAQSPSLNDFVRRLVEQIVEAEETNSQASEDV